MFMLNKIQSIANSELVYSAHLMVLKISIDISICCLSSNSLNAILDSPGNVMSCAKLALAVTHDPRCLKIEPQFEMLGNWALECQVLREFVLRVLSFSIASELRI